MTGVASLLLLDGRALLMKYNAAKFKAATLEHLNIFLSLFHYLTAMTPVSLEKVYVFLHYLIP